MDYGIQAVLGKANTDNEQHRSGPQHVLLLHQYFQPDNAPSGDTNHYRPPGVDADGYLLPRNLQNNVRRFEHYYLEDFQAQYGNLKVIFSEYGLDGRIGLGTSLLMQNPSRGWKNFDEWRGMPVPQTVGGTKPADGAPYLEALKALDRSNRGYSKKLHEGVILGYCIYGWGYNCSYQFWSYPLDETPQPDPDCGPIPVDGADPKNTQETRDATLTEGLVNHAESLRTQKENNDLPLQLRLNHVSKGHGLPITATRG